MLASSLAYFCSFSRVEEKGGLLGEAAIVDFASDEEFGDTEAHRDRGWSPHTGALVSVATL